MRKSKYFSGYLAVLILFVSIAIYVTIGELASLNRQVIHQEHELERLLYENIYLVKGWDLYELKNDHPGLYQVSKIEMLQSDKPCKCNGVPFIDCCGKDGE